MIPRANITAWRKNAPWPDNNNVEQDLVLSRALVELFNCPDVAEYAVIRGGTALHKLYLDPAGRYSEDIDLVQRQAGAIGPFVDKVRAVLDPWLGKPKWKAGRDRFTLYYRFDTDLFYLALGLDLDTDELVVAFERYMAFSSTRVTRAQFEANMADKMADATFLGDVPALLRTGLDYDPDEAWARVHDAIITKLPGKPWKGRPD